MVDARIRYTKHAIKQEFIALLEEKPIEKITVKRICEGAQINRATFYCYFDNPYDLLEKIENDLLDELEEKIRLAEPDGFQGIIRIALADIQSKPDYYQLLFSEAGDQQFRDRIFKICYEGNLPVIEHFFPDMPKIQQEFLYYFIAEGCNGILKRWMLHGMKEPVEELVGFVEDLVNTINESLPR